MGARPKSGKRLGSGRKPTVVGPARTMRLSDEFIATIDAWAQRQEDNLTRSEAIRRLVEIGLTKPVRLERTRSGRPLELGHMAKLSSTPAKKAARRSRAQELAAEAIETMIDPAAPPEERAQRRRRLTKGPPEFRELRVDLPRAETK
jgi:hypothetical protein